MSLLLMLFALNRGAFESNYISIPRSKVGVAAGRTRSARHEKIDRKIRSAPIGVGETRKRRRT